MDPRKKSLSQRPSSGESSWVEKSNAYASRLIEADARFDPERYGQCGYEGVDEEVTRLHPDIVEQKVETFGAIASEFGRLLPEEADSDVAFDLEIMIENTAEETDRLRLEADRLLPYPNVPGTIFNGIHTLLEGGDGEGGGDGEAALVRLERYRLLPRQAQTLIRSRLGEPGLLGPFKDAVELDLATSESYGAAIEELFEKSTVCGYEKPLAALRAELGDYQVFVRGEVLPRSRGDFRLPPELYAAYRRMCGVELPAAELARWARVEFDRTQSELRELAREMIGGDYRDVIRELKKDQLTGEEILPYYHQRINDLECLVERQGLLTLPTMEIRVLLASEGESLMNPSPHVRLPRLLSPVARPIEFVMPIKAVGTGGECFDDITCRAAVDSLAIHEVLGHGVQFATVFEQKVSLARRFLTFNHTNAEGWATYMEDELSGYLPLAVRILSLRRRLLRSGRAFLESELQEGVTSLSEASRILRDDVGLSAAMVEQELQRYTFRRPGQACTYFCGAALLAELRSRARQLLGPRFERGEFHDFLLAQGFLFFKSLRRRLEEGFVTVGFSRNRSTQ